MNQKKRVDNTFWASRKQKGERDDWIDLKTMVKSGAQNKQKANRKAW